MIRFASRLSIFVIVLFSCLKANGQMTPSFRFNTFGTEKKSLTNQTISDVEPDKFYKTPNYSEWLRLDRANTSKQEEIGRIEKEIHDDADGTGIMLSDGDRIQKREEIAKQKKQIEENEVIIDSVWLAYVAEFLNYKPSVFGFGPYRSLALYNIMKADDKGNPFRFVSSASLNFGPNTSSLSSELFTGCWSLLHVSFGSMLTVSSTDDPEKAKKEEAVQRLAQNGGNTYLKLDYPIWYIHTNTSIRFTGILRAFVKGTADLPNFGTQSDSFATSGAYGGDLYLNFGAPLRGFKVEKDRSLNVFAYFNFARYKGSNEYKDNLGIQTTAFNYGQLGAGIVFNNTIKISFIFNTLSSVKALRSGRVIGGGELLN